MVCEEVSWIHGGSVDLRGEFMGKFVRRSVSLIEKSFFNLAVPPNPNGDLHDGFLVRPVVYGDCKQLLNK
jgi:hypothetical protein